MTLSHHSYFSYDLFFKSGTKSRGTRDFFAGKNSAKKSGKTFSGKPKSRLPSSAADATGLSPTPAPRYSDRLLFARILTGSVPTFALQLMLIRHFKMSDVKNPIRAVYWQKSGLIVPFFPEFDLFSGARKRGPDKVGYKGSDWQSGHNLRG
jgi:hypothetical protein